MQSAIRMGALASVISINQAGALYRGQLRIKRDCGNVSAAPEWDCQGGRQGGSGHSCANDAQFSVGASGVDSP
jgi:hypothetical protein